MDLTPIMKLNRDIVTASVTLSETEARFLVDAYYSMQKNRLRHEGQIRSMADEPHEILSFFASQAETLENQIKRALDRYSAAHPVGEWLRGVRGIGPVIAAGLLAHIDIRKAHTVGHIWRFAGLDPSVTWRSAEFVRGFVKAARAESSDDWQALIKICREVKRRPLDVLHQAKQIESIPDPDDIRKYLAGKNAAAIRAEYHPDNMLQEALSDETLPESYRELCGEIKFDWQAINRTLSRRPWNAQLKVLCWKAGDSFVTFSNDESCYYGQIYKSQKALYNQRNESGNHAERAASILEAKRFGKDTEAYKHYTAGRLPPAQIHAMARRYAVKLFLSHLHAEMYRRVLDKEPPLPYPIAHLGHAHVS
jgi:hypothetical protein